MNPVAPVSATFIAGASSFWSLEPVLSQDCRHTGERLSPEPGDSRDRAPLRLPGSDRDAGRLKANTRLFVVGRSTVGPSRPNLVGGSWRSRCPHLVPGDLTQPGLAQCRAPIASDVRSPPASIIHGPPRGNHGHSAPSALTCSVSNLNGIEQLTAHSGGIARALRPQLGSRSVASAVLGHARRPLHLSSHKEHKGSGGRRGPRRGCGRDDGGGPGAA
jgi:hypothetical protein